MSLRKTVGVVVCLSLSTAMLQAQLSEVNSRQDFSTESTEFDFEGPKHGAFAGDLFSRWGLRFSDGSGGVTTIMTRTELVFTDNSLLNGMGTSSSAGIPLVIDLKYPAKKIGFDLGNGDENTPVSVTAFDGLGNNLGSIQRTGLGDPSFLGVGVAGAGGISKLMVSYGNSVDAEEIDDLVVEYVDRPEFKTFLAQIANGLIENFGTFQTTIIVTNSSNSTAVGELALFDSDGLPLEMDFGDGPKSTLSLELPPRSSKTFVSTGTALGVGYARVQTNVPTDGTAIFRLTLPSGVIASEAGVGSDAGRVDVVGAVEKVAAEGFDSGIAVVNVSGTQADGEILLYDQSGEEVGRNRNLLDLPPGEHTSGFLSTIFSELEGEDFSGTIQIASDVPLAVVIMRTVGGIVISSLPVSSLEK